jgi:hypothetical protein
MEPQPYPAHGCLLLATAVDRDLPARQVLHRAAAALARAGTADLAGKAVLKGETRANPEVRGEAHLMFRYGFGLSPVTRLEDALRLILVDRGLGELAHVTKSQL